MLEDTELLLVVPISPIIRTTCGFDPNSGILIELLESKPLFKHFSSSLYNLSNHLYLYAHF